MFALGAVAIAHRQAMVFLLCLLTLRTTFQGLLCTISKKFGIVYMSRMFLLHLLSLAYETLIAGMLDVA